MFRAIIFPLVLAFYSLSGYAFQATDKSPSLGSSGSNSTSDPGQYTLNFFPERPALLDAAMRGNAEAMFIIAYQYFYAARIASFHLNDDKLANQRALEGIRWLSKAAARGHARAKFEIGKALLTEDELVNAYLRFSDAARHGYSPANEFVRQLDSTMAPDILAEAQSLVRHLPAPIEDNYHSWGSGFFISKNRILTAYHVVNECDAVRVTPASWNQIGAGPPDGTDPFGELVAFDETLDVALLKVSFELMERNTLALRSPPELVLGEAIYFGGYSFRGGTAPVFNFDKGSVGGLFEPKRPNFQLTAAVHRGYSGSAVLDSDGVVIGIVLAKPFTAFDTAEALREFEMGQFADVAQMTGYALDSSAISDFLGAHKVAFRTESDKQSGVVNEPELLAGTAHATSALLQCWKAPKYRSWDSAF